MCHPSGPQLLTLEQPRDAVPQATANVDGNVHSCLNYHLFSFISNEASKSGDMRVIVARFVKAMVILQVIGDLFVFDKPPAEWSTLDGTIGASVG